MHGQITASLPLYHPGSCLSMCDSEDGILHGGAHISVAKKRIFVVGAGKASGAMALELERILGQRILQQA